MQKSYSILTGIKFIYLVIFFALLSGLFYPIIEQNSDFSEVAAGTAILFMGLGGALLLYKAINSEKKNKIFMASGFAVLVVTLFLIFSISGRI